MNIYIYICIATQYTYMSSMLRVLYVEDIEYTRYIGTPIIVYRNIEIHMNSHI